MNRPEEAHDRRDDATNCQTNRCYAMPNWQTPDEKSFPRYAASFHKLLLHGADGLLDSVQGVQSYAELLKGLDLYGDSSGFDANALNSVYLPYGGSKRRVLINPRSSKAFSVKGPDVAGFAFYPISPLNPDPAFEWGNNFEVRYAPPRPEKGGCGDLPYYPAALLEELSFSSGPTAAEMVELYGMVLLRDYSLDSFPANDARVALVIDALNAFGDEFRGPKENGKVTPKTLFRGNGEGSIRGDYRSQFLTQYRGPQFPSGCSPDTADLIHAGMFFWDFAEPLTAPRPNPSREWGLTLDHHVRIQNGDIPDPYRYGDFYKPAVQISTGRQLASLVHVDAFYQEWSFALDILSGGNYPRSKASIYGDPTAPQRAEHEGDGPTYGIPDAAGLLGAAALLAGRAAWHSKWLVARRARPEVLAALVSEILLAKLNPNDFPLDVRLKEPTGAVANLLQAIQAHNLSLSHSSERNYLLSQVFPEGSPAHPSWTSGHATVSGACCTVLKAIFDDLAPVKSQRIHGNIKDERGRNLLVGRELDKLASNEAFGRNFAGVHYRSDGEHGIQLGEAVAIRLLMDHLREYAEQIPGRAEEDGPPTPYFELTRRDGVRIRIYPCEVVELSPGETAAMTEAAEAADEPRTHRHPML